MGGTRRRAGNSRAGWVARGSEPGAGGLARGPQTGFSTLNLGPTPDGWQGARKQDGWHRALGGGPQAEAGRSWMGPNYMGWRL